MTKPAAQDDAVDRWNRLLRRMHDASTKESYYAKFWLRLEHDNDATALVQALRNNPQVDSLVLDMSFRFTERGAHVLAQGILQSQVSSITMRIDREYLSRAVAIMQILYLEGNQPLIETDNHCLQRAFDGLRLEQNDKRLTKYALSLYHNDPFLIGNALRGNTSLQRLEILGQRLDIFGGGQQDTARGASALAEGIRLSQVKEVGLEEYSDECNNCEFLSIICQDGINASGRLLEVRGRVEDSAILASILPSLKSLTLCTSKSTGACNLDFFSKSLRQTTSLTALRLSSCMLGDLGMMTLSQGLLHNKSIRELMLSGNRIGDDGIISFVQNWHEDSPLACLLVGYNNFGIDGLRLLLAAVARHCHTMEELSLTGCTNIGLPGFQLIALEIPHLMLRSLNISNCLVRRDFTPGNKRAKQAYEDALASNWQRVVDGIHVNSYLHHLDVYGNVGLYGKSMNEIVYCTALNSHGRHLLTNGQALPSTVWCYILAKCLKHKSHSRSLVFYFLVEQPQLMMTTSSFHFSGRCCERRQNT